jgi:hypothetical protein
MWPVEMRRHWQLETRLSAVTLHLRQLLKLLPAVTRWPKKLPQTILQTIMVLQVLPHSKLERLLLVVIRMVLLLRRLKQHLPLLTAVWRRVGTRRRCRWRLDRLLPAVISHVRMPGQRHMWLK